MLHYVKYLSSLTKINQFPLIIHEWVCRISVFWPLIRSKPNYKYILHRRWKLWAILPLYTLRHVLLLTVSYGSSLERLECYRWRHSLSFLASASPQAHTYKRHTKTSTHTYKFKFPVKAFLIYLHAYWNFNDIETRPGCPYWTWQRFCNKQHRQSNAWNFRSHTHISRHRVNSNFGRCKHFPILVSSAI